MKSLQDKAIMAVDDLENEGDIVLYEKDFLEAYEKLYETLESLRELDEATYELIKYKMENIFGYSESDF